MPEKEIRYEDAASRVTATGWACNTCHRWYGDAEGAEHLARWCCATDLPCECGGRLRKPWSACESCREQRSAERWAKLPREEWDGTTPLYSEELQRFLWDEDEVWEAIEEAGGDTEALRLCLCRPQPPRELDLDYWEDDLPEDGDYLDLPDELREAVDVLNEVIKRQSVLSWWATQTAAVLPGKDSEAPHA